MPLAGGATLVGVGTGHDEVQQRCMWCGRRLDERAVLCGFTTDPVAGREIVVTACCREHLTVLQGGSEPDSDSRLPQ
ncbi:hypothetical protein BJF85_06660 [Saccharomonospora sp. CUA-673]|uniref:hypothetical protein n=1 Tax=Saccharomonospora sp. CUA-673 TaxID=1904969 RepID=UPI0009592D05|nr:hypothetical protein [Saccharomonospora sp. CUA-673]OLT40014.1 hypothetical protein BJF85_06660 [Saccharomonospora sp. CUA-673]